MAAPQLHFCFPQVVVTRHWESPWVEESQHPRPVHTLRCHRNLGFLLTLCAALSIITCFSYRAFGRRRNSIVLFPTYLGNLLVPSTPNIDHRVPVKTGDRGLERRASELFLEKLSPGRFPRTITPYFLCSFSPRVPYLLTCHPRSYS